jgi:hypothetical protein
MNMRNSKDDPIAANERLLAQDADYCGEVPCEVIKRINQIAEDERKTGTWTKK